MIAPMTPGKSADRAYVVANPVPLAIRSAALMTTWWSSLARNP